MKASERSVIIPITLGGFLEWYEVFLYIYWIPIISQNFFDLSLTAAEFINLFFVMFIGLFARPLGGLLFGSFGDRKGRKNAFILSIVLISIPSFLTAFAPSFSSWSLFFIIYIGVMKFLQGVTAGGELPGALCFLSEMATPERKRYLCSYLFVGPQIGQVVSMAQCFLMQRYCSHEFLVHYGWRIAFFIGGLLGIGGFYLRRKLLESHLFQRLQEKREVLKNPIIFSLKNYKKKIALGFLVSIFEVVGFFLVAFFIVANANQVFNLNLKDYLLLNVLVFTPIAFVMPFIGKIGDRYKNKDLYVLSTIAVVVFAVLFYYSMSISIKFFEVLFFILLVFSLCFPFALLPSLIADLFPTKVRFTCVALSFNVCDSIVGGLTPILTLLLMQKFGGPISVVLMLSIGAAIFLLTLPFIKFHEAEKMEL